MADHARKTELAERLAKSRADFTRDWQQVRAALDVPAHLKSSFVQHKSAWLGGAAVVGWLISRLPARKKKVYVDPKSNRKLKLASEAGLALGLGKMIFSALQPAVSAFAAKKVTDYLARGGSSGSKSGQR